MRGRRPHLLPLARGINPSKERGGSFPAGTGGVWFADMVRQDKVWSLVLDGVTFAARRGVWQGVSRLPAVNLWLAGGAKTELPVLGYDRAELDSESETEYIDCY